MLLEIELGHDCRPSVLPISDNPSSLLGLRSVADSRCDFSNAAQGILRSLINHNGKGVENVADGKPAKWRLTEVAN
jgi:hypothetical protein